MSPARAICLWLVLAGAQGPAACSGRGTSLLLAVDPSQAPGVQQLHVTGRVEGTLVFGPAIRPDRAGDALDGTQTLRVLVPDDTAGKTVTVRVEGLMLGEARASAETDVRPDRGHEVRVELALALDPVETVCAGCSGCCAQGQCVGASVAACGAGGVQCFACDPARADRCTEEGRCGCGAGPSCSPARGADRCIDGGCQCGDGPPCPSGTECDNGVCRCTPAACAGCCEANECLAGTTDSACGAGGGACMACTTSRVCSAGLCVSR